jgi:nucleoside-diphosphate-sugar epimerase
VLEGQRILITGCTSQVARPLAAHLAENNEVYGLARFRRASDRESMEAIGVRCVAADLAADRLADVPPDVDYVLHFAVTRSAGADFAADLAMNAEGAGRLLAHCHCARAFLHCSSAAVYHPPGHRPATEHSPLGDHHRVMMPTYSLAKICAEVVVQFAAKQWNVPTTIARLSVPYGNNGGWPWYHLMMMKAGQPIPVHTVRPSVFNPIHEDDYIAQIPGLLEIASVPATVINWGGSEVVSIEQWCGYLGELTGLEPRFEYTEQTLSSLPLDVSELEARVGKSRVTWRDGLRRLVEARNPELLVLA